MIKRQLSNLFRKPFTGKFLGGKLSDLLIKNPNSLLLRKLVPDNDLHPKDTERFCNRYGVNFLLDLNDYQQWLLYFSDSSDSSLDVLLHIQPGYTVIDVGGNIGQTALIMAKKVGNAGKIISFEPYPETIKRFELNLEINKDIENVKLEKFALGDTESTINIFQDCVTNSGGNRVLHSFSENPVGVKKVQVKTLDSYVKTEELSNIDLIKIDVEGFEMNVLKGAAETLLKFKPVLIVEVDQNNLINQGATTKDLLDFLHKYNYKTLDISDMKEFSVQENSSIHTDIICFPSI